MILLLLFATLPLATGPHEIVMAAALALALLGPSRGALQRLPWARPALAAALVWVLAAPASGNLREGLGHAWLLAPLAAVPALLAGASGAPAAPLPGPLAAWRARPLAERVTGAGLAAASLAAAWAVAQRLAGGVGTAGMSHHLSLAYALLPPLGVAVAGRRWGAAAILAGGVVATGSAGAGVALATTIVGARTRRPLPALTAGVVGTLALLGLADADELRQRAVLWTGGLLVAEGGPAGPGAYAAASAPAYDALVPGFWFPNHAHDGAIQALAVLGPAGLVATLALCLALLRHGAAGAAAGLAGVLVGGLTQDVLGDLEVARAAWAWIALGGLGMADARTSREPDRPDGY